MPDDADSTRAFLEECRDATEDELMDVRAQVQESLQNLRFRTASGQIDDPKRIRKYRKAIARINTILGERELGINQGR
ncbi:MAG: 50S ribosomal protein L29 [candidate division WS1 bacterium]|jgi:large subunit ribosomal protein L29|nr:50S ribosomal protein L29 [candidate division WS1 bacterium]